MHIAEATELIWIDKISGDRAQTWCDLGCGTGTFTLVLATLLSPGSVIHAIDKNEKSLSQIPDRYQEVTIHKESRSRSRKLRSHHSHPDMEQKATDSTKF